MLQKNGEHSATTQGQQLQAAPVVTHHPVVAHGAFCLHPCSKSKLENRHVPHDIFNETLVFERDGWTCQHCGIPTPKELRGTNLPNAPELDHVYPKACGGAHSLANTQCLCRTCNGIKKDDVVKEPKLTGVTDSTVYTTARYPAVPRKAKGQAFVLKDRSGQVFGSKRLVAYQGRRRYTWECAHGCGRSGTSEWKQVRKAAARGVKCPCTRGIQAQGQSILDGLEGTHPGKPLDAV